LLYGAEKKLQKTNKTENSMKLIISKSTVMREAITRIRAYSERRNIEGAYCVFVFVSQFSTQRSFRQFLCWQSDRKLIQVENNQEKIHTTSRNFK
jgi:DNA-binding response OmpR family regulator